MDDSNNIKIPIKAIIENAMEEEACNFDEEEIMLLREYFIACLNLIFLFPHELEEHVSKFTSKIKSISYGADYNPGEKPYYIKNDELVVAYDLYENDEALFKINFFKAVTEVIFDCVETDNGFSNAICNLVAEYVFNMITEDSRIIAEQQQLEKIGEITIYTYIGGHQLNVIMTLFKEMCLSQNVYDKLTIRKMFVEGYDKGFADLMKKNIFVPILVKKINQIFELQVKRHKTGEASSEELEYIENYQAVVNSLFPELDDQYFHFWKLVTSPMLKMKLIGEKLGVSLK